MRMLRWTSKNTLRYKTNYCILKQLEIVPIEDN